MEVKFEEKMVANHFHNSEAVEPVDRTCITLYQLYKVLSL